MYGTLSYDGTDHDGQFHYVFTLHRGGVPAEVECAVPAAAKKIIEPEDDEWEVRFIIGRPPAAVRAAGRGAGHALRRPQRHEAAHSAMRLHHGQDYYNLGFAQTIARLQFGVTLQRDQFLSFRLD
jgi:hypothetical protein